MEVGIGSTSGGDGASFDCWFGGDGGVATGERTRPLSTASQEEGRWQCCTCCWWATTAASPISDCRLGIQCFVLLANMLDDSRVGYPQSAAWVLSRILLGYGGYVRNGMKQCALLSSTAKHWSVLAMSPERNSVCQRGITVLLLLTLWVASCCPSAWATFGVCPTIRHRCRRQLSQLRSLEVRHFNPENLKGRDRERQSRPRTIWRRSRLQPTPSSPLLHTNLSPTPSS